MALLMIDLLRAADKSNSSASLMKMSGGTAPSSLSLQRASASKPDIFPELASMIGW
ncbi:hypothetical protein D3C76_1786400 [compost metagenome]